MEAARILNVDQLAVKIFYNRSDLGNSAADDVAALIKKLLREKSNVNIVFAAAPSQNEFLEFLCEFNDIEWERVNAFHMDEYVGLRKESPQSFGNFLNQRIFSKVKFRTVNLINGSVDNPQIECIRYTQLLRKDPPDIICMGIGENGHIAFNDPHIALFKDPEVVKVVELDIISRQQQVNDGCFSSLEEVPQKAITLTIPTLFDADNIFCIVPGKNKARAVENTIYGEIAESCPASIIKAHNNATLYLDLESSSGLV